jgi:hypothetical protein
MRQEPTSPMHCEDSHSNSRGLNSGDIQCSRTHLIGPTQGTESGYGGEERL